MNKYWNCCDCGDIDCPGRPNDGVCNKELEKEITGQTVYEQLQEILLELNKLGYTYGGMFMSGNLVVNEGGIYYKETIMNTVAKISYHELFSKDSGIMKFVEWKPPLHKYIGTEADLDYYKQHGKLSFHYMIMGQMTSEQKIQYFLDNVIIPTK